MTSLLFSVLLSTNAAYAAPVAGDAALDPIPAVTLLEGPLPTEIELDLSGWTADGRQVTGTDAEMEAAFILLLSQAEGNAEQIERAHQRSIVSLLIASGGVGFESAGVVVAVAIAAGVVSPPVGAALGVPLVLGGAAVGLTGVTLGVRNRPLRRAVENYNVWADAHPEALEDAPAQGTPI